MRLCGPTVRKKNVICTSLLIHKYIFIKRHPQCRSTVVSVRAFLLLDYDLTFVTGMIKLFVVFFVIKTCWLWWVSLYFNFPASQPSKDAGKIKRDGFIPAHVHSFNRFIGAERKSVFPRQMKLSGKRMFNYILSNQTGYCQLYHLNVPCLSLNLHSWKKKAKLITAIW